MRLVVNSQFFLDPESWDFLGSDILPQLQRNSAPLRSWSAGCSAGKEPFSLAMLLLESEPVCNPYILATDRDESALSIARDGGPFSAKDMELVPSPWVEKHSIPGGPPFFVRPHLRQAVEFRIHDLASEPYPRPFDLILYRNLETCFSPGENAAIWRNLRAALRPGGVLFTGAVDRPPRQLDGAFAHVGKSFYRRPAAD